MQDTYMQIELVEKAKYVLIFRTKSSHLKIVARLEMSEYSTNFPTYNIEKIIKQRHPLSYIIKDLTIPLFGAAPRSKSIIAEVQKDIEDEIDMQLDKYDFNRKSLIIDAIEGMLQLA